MTQLDLYAFGSLGWGKHCKLGSFAFFCHIKLPPLVGSSGRCWCTWFVPPRTGSWVAVLDGQLETKVDLLMLDLHEQAPPSRFKARMFNHIHLGPHGS